MIFSKQPQRDNIEIMLARKCGFYIRGKQQGLAEDEISMPILMTQTLHEMLVHFADEVRTITKAVYDVEIEPLRVRATQAENIALEQQAEITSLRAELEKAKKDGWISVEDRMPENVHIEHLTVGHSKAVLGYVKDNLCTFCVSYDYEHKAWRYFCDSNHIVRHEITHWQPLPEPPKE